MGTKTDFESFSKKTIIEYRLNEFFLNNSISILRCCVDIGAKFFGQT